MRSSHLPAAASPAALCRGGPGAGHPGGGHAGTGRPPHLWPVPHTLGGGPESSGSEVREDSGPSGDRSGSRPLWDFHEPRGLRSSAWPEGRRSGSVSRGQRGEGPGHSLTRASNAPSAPRASPRAVSSWVIHHLISLLDKLRHPRPGCLSYPVRTARERQTQDPDPWLI